MTRSLRRERQCRGMRLNCINPADAHRALRLISQSPESPAKMSFTITRKLEQLPSYSMLCKLAGQNHICVTGNEHAGSFSSRGVEGNYKFGEDCIRVTFGGRGVTGEFSCESGRAAVTITDKPFWLPEVFLKQKITEWLDTLDNKLAGQGSA